MPENEEIHKQENSLMGYEDCYRIGYHLVLPAAESMVRVPVPDIRKGDATGSIVHFSRSDPRPGSTISAVMDTVAG